MPSTVNDALSRNITPQPVTLIDSSGAIITTLPISGTFARSAITVLNQASAAQTANGNSADLTISSYVELSIDVNVTAVSGSSSPTLQVFFDRKGADAVYYPIWESGTMTATGAVSTAIGAGMSIAQGFGSTGRLRWVITGSSPSFTFSASIIGK